MLTRYAKVLMMIFAAAFLFNGCAEEKKMLVVPVAGLPPNYTEQKAELLTLLQADFPELKPNALAAIDSVSRMVFVTAEARHRSYLIKTIVDSEGNEKRVYDDKALPIGNGQSLLKLSDIAFLLSKLDIQPSDHIYEVGSGNGYFSAILSRLGTHVYGLEINERLNELGIQMLQRMKIIEDKSAVDASENDASQETKFREHVKLCCGNGLPQSLPEIPAETLELYKKMACRNDGLYGLVAYAPYDVVIITASISLKVPVVHSENEENPENDSESPQYISIETYLNPILKLMNPGGRLAVPVFDTNGNSIWHLYHWNNGTLEEFANRPTGIKAALIPVPENKVSEND